MSQSKPPIYILGAGPAGLAAAYTLAKADRPIVLVEREERVGGLAKSIEHKGFILDLGPHRFFTKVAPVLALWDEVLGTDQVTVDRLTRISYGGKFFQYPLKATEALLALGLVETVRILASYAAVRLRPNPAPANFAEWVIDKFGRRLYEIFFEGYTRKLWGIPCTEISADWAAQRIKGMSLVAAVRAALFGSDGRVKSMIDQFQYPRLGAGQLYEKIADFLLARRQPVIVETESVAVRHDGRRVSGVRLRNRVTGQEGEVPVEGLISSIPLTHLLQQLDPPPPAAVLAAASSLRFRNTVLVYVFVNRPRLFPDNWLYVNDGDIQLGRVTNFANWSPAMLADAQQTPLCCEYWSFFDEPLWQMAEGDLRAMAERDLRRIGLLKDEQVVDGFVVKLPNVYPVYAGDYKQALATIQGYLAGFENLQLIGRYGTFKYNNQDHSLLMGIMAAENLLDPGRHDLWATNSDDEYQEEARVGAA